MGKNLSNKVSEAKLANIAKFNEILTKFFKDLEGQKVVRKVGKDNVEFSRMPTIPAMFLALDITEERAKDILANKMSPYHNPLVKAMQIAEAMIVDISKNEGIPGGASAIVALELKKFCGYEPRFMVPKQEPEPEFKSDRLKAIESSNI